MFQVYFLDKRPVGTNQFGIPRTEDWRLVKDQTFSSRSAAEEFVIRHNRRLDSYRLGIQHLLGPFDDLSALDQGYVRSRCLEDNRYITERSYHLASSLEQLTTDLREGLQRHQDDDYRVIFQ